MGDRITQMINIQSKALELFIKKNTDYGDAFAKYGIIGVLIRIQDKIQRALSITSNNINFVEDESISDTMIDLHNYAAMALMLMEEGKADKYLEVNTDSDDDSQTISFLELDENNSYDLGEHFNPYISISYPFQVNGVEYGLNNNNNNECDEDDRDEDVCQEV
jgi:hypothetical protein